MGQKGQLGLLQFLKCSLSLCNYVGTAWFLNVALLSVIWIDGLAVQAAGFPWASHERLPQRKGRQGRGCLTGGCTFSSLRLKDGRGEANKPEQNEKRAVENGNEYPYSTLGGTEQLPCT
jgi:hypothetical protein